MLSLSGDVRKSPAFTLKFENSQNKRTLMLLPSSTSYKRIKMLVKIAHTLTQLQKIKVSKLQKDKNVSIPTHPSTEKDKMLVNDPPTKLQKDKTLVRKLTLLKSINSKFL